MKQIIEITVMPNGETKIETKGFTGDSCRDASRSLELALGNRTSEQLKAEYHQPQVTASPLRQQS